MNLSIGVAGLVILMSGVLLFAVSAPVFRYTARVSSSETQFSPEMVKWLGRGMGLILFMLGLVTFLNQ